MGSRIAVIGAGVAGLSAARSLRDAGHQPIVFERAASPGGRVSTRFFAGVERRRSGTLDLALDDGAQYFTARSARFKEQVDRWLDARVVSRWSPRLVAFDGEGWDPVEDGTERFVGTPSMSAWAAHLAEGLSIEYGRTVDPLTAAWAAAFDGILVAVPAGESSRLLAGFSNLSTSVAAVAMQPCWTVMTAFESSVTPRFDAAFVARSPLGWIARNSSKPRRDRQEAWVLHATREWSAAHVHDRPDVVGPFLLDAFAELVRGGLPRPLFASASRWREAAADPPLNVGALYDADRRVAVCGDWCLGTRVEDAWTSGVAAASLLTSS